MEVHFTPDVQAKLEQWVSLNFLTHTRQFASAPRRR